MTFQQRIEGSKELSHTDIQANSVLGRRNNLPNSPSAWCVQETVEKPVWLEQSEQGGQ